MQIKFRGKSLSTGEWVYGSLLHGENIVLPSGKAYPVDPKTVGQYIRDNDKDEKEIYEGDIVRGYFASLDFEGNEHGKVETVIVDDIAYAREYLEDVQQRTLEIIGNIHDNPTLLTQ